MPLRVFFAIHVGDSLAHVYRTRNIARDLLLAGHEVCYPVPAWARPHLGDHLPPSVLRESNQGYSFARYPVLRHRMAQVIQHARAEWEAFRAFDPHVVIGDTGLIAHSYRPRVPFLKILGRFYFEVGHDGLSPYSCDQLDLIASQVEVLVNEAATTLNQPATFRYSDLLAGDALLCTDDALSLDLQRPRWTAAGFSAMSGAITKGSARTAFIGLGTGLAKHQASVASRMLRQAEDLFERLYVSVGFGSGSKTLHIPKNAIARERFTAIPEDVGTLISHGGLASVQVALRSHLPLILVPLQVEQYSNAWHAERIGLGINCGQHPGAAWGGLDTRVDYLPERFEWAVEAARLDGSPGAPPLTSTRRPLTDVVREWLQAHS